MEKKTGNNIRLGLFLTIGILLFIAGIYFIGQKQMLFNRTFHISAMFKDINGLQIGNNVRYTGLNIGIVNSIEQVTDSTVKVNMQINESTKKFINKNAKATIGSDGLMGNKIVSIVPGKPGSPEISDNDIIETVQPVNMDDVFLKLKVTGDNVANMSEDLAGIMKNIHEGKGTIGKLLMDSVLAENVSQTFVNIKQGAGGFKKNMDAASHSILLRGYLKKQKKDEEQKKNEKNNKK
jgi:phospholipid/cholesterol/gamma-HCH transport system substrate-binding protein